MACLGWNFEFKKTEAKNLKGDFEMRKQKKAIMIRGGTKITESIIAKAGLDSQEAMVIRVFIDSKSAGKSNSRTKKFVRELSAKKHNLLFHRAEEKIVKFLNGAKK